MLGKINDQGKLAFIYNSIIKTSNSGLFGNKRLAIFSVQEAIVGYQSKIPEPFEAFQDLNCIQQCKEIINLRNQKSLVYYVKPQDKTILILTCENTKQKKSWEFKFQSENLSLQWYQCIHNTLNPLLNLQLSRKKQIDQEFNKIDFSKLKEVSRFSRFEAQEEVNSQSRPQTIEQKVEDIQHKQQIRINVEPPPSQPSYRFKDYQRQNNMTYESVNHPIPIITTFREKFPNNTIFSSIAKQKSKRSSQDQEVNWNLTWYQAIETEQQQARIDIYNNFLRTCQKTCKEIIKELTILKTYRKYVPQKITMNEQIYNHQNISYRLNIQKDIQSNDDGLCSNNYLNLRRIIMDNFQFILKATKNKGLIKVPLACIVQYYGFSFYCQANIPSQFIEVDHSEKYIFLPQIQRLESQLKLKINLAHIELYTQKIASIVEQSRGKRSHYIIMTNIRRLLPEFIGINSNPYSLCSNIFLKANDIYQKDHNFTEENEKGITNFFKIQNITCSIISFQDLKEAFYTSNLSYGMITQVLGKCDNKYLSKIFITELISQVFCFIVRCQIMIFVNKWNKNVQVMLNETPDYEIYIYKLLSDFLSENISTDTRIWNIIYNELFAKYNLNIRMDQIIIGYLLSSISFKLGINLDYQLLFLQRHHFFDQDILIPQESIKSFEPIFVKYTNEDMCQSYEAMMHEINFVEEQKTLDNVIRFYKLNEEKHELQPYHWKKICKLFSFFVPYGNESEKNNLQIYQYLNLLFLDYSIEGILVSATKWLLHSQKIDLALELVYFFKEISWFWLSQNNPFLISLYQILAEFYRSNFNLLQSISYFIKCNQSLDKLFKGGAQLQNLDRNYQLAQIYMVCNMHKEALSKYREVLRLFKKYDKDSLDILDIMVEISKLYLHLGDIQNCFRSCKSTIQFSILNPFKDELQEFQIYSLLLRSFQIKQELHKYKFYVDIIEDKFQASKNPLILQNVLRLTMEQILQKQYKYTLKKIGFLLYSFQKSKKGLEEDGSIIETFNLLKKTINNQHPCKLLREIMEKSLEISDLMAQKETETEEELYRNTELLRLSDQLILFCNFIGYEFILGNIVINLTKKQFS